MSSSRKRSNKKSSQNNNKEAKILSDTLLTFLKSNPSAPLNAKQISSKLGFEGKEDQDRIYKALQTLLLLGEIEEVQPGKFIARKPFQVLSGRVDYLSSGNAYVISSESEKDIFIHARYLANAYHGDVVKVLLFPKKGATPEGEILEVLERGKSEWVGTLAGSPTNMYVSPDSNRIPFSIYIPLDVSKGASPGMKVVARITDWPVQQGMDARGEVLRILGKSGENNAEMHAILEEYGLPYEFPPEVEDDAEKISFDLPQAEIRKRRDFRDTLTFTIDPVDAKDFDDALSIKELGEGKWEIGVHIADVSHYVTPGSRLDKEAVKRATSVYLVDRVVPMLPEKLSNGVCSLRPDEDKFTFSAVFVMNEKAEVLEQWFGRTVIHSDRRFSYEEAQEIIEGREDSFAGPILLLHKMAQILRGHRFKDGALRVDQAEVKFLLDENGKPVDVYFKIQREANQLIEEFMLLANKKVTEFVAQPKGKKRNRPFVYRVHDLPDESKLQDFASFVKTLGYHLELDNPKKISKNINALLAEVQDKPEGDMIRQLAIRSMAKAIYSTKNIGHYGLSFDYYTHFTSPIRRYPDVLVHRLLQTYLDDENATPKESDLEQLCNHSSERERLAAEAERASIKYKQVEFMLDRVGRVYSGVITGVTEWGIYVEIEETRCEGMVRLREMRDDFYFFDEKRMAVFGKSRKKSYRLGDRVNVLVNKVDMDKRQIDLLFENL